VSVGDAMGRFDVGDRACFSGITQSRDRLLGADQVIDLTYEMPDGSAVKADCDFAGEQHDLATEMPELAEEM
jgi:hypothetical protein